MKVFQFYSFVCIFGKIKTCFQFDRNVQSTNNIVTTLLKMTQIDGEEFYWNIISCNNV